MDSIVKRYLMKEKDSVRGFVQMRTGWRS